MKPILWHLGPLPVYAWGTMLSLAVILGVIGARRLAVRAKIEPDRILDLAIWLIIAGLLGGRLFYAVFYEPDYFAVHPWAVLNLTQPGLVFYGGLIAGTAAGGWYVYRHKLSFWNLADVITPFLALGYGLVRVGCFLNGCCYGKPTEVPWGVVFPGLWDATRHPTQLYSSGLALLIFFVTWWLFYHRRFTGQVFLTYLMLYAVTRSLVEIFRENLLVWGPITIAQVVSIGLFLGALLGYIYRQRQAEAAVLPEQGRQE